MTRSSEDERRCRKHLRKEGDVVHYWVVIKAFPTLGPFILTIHHKRYAYDEAKLVDCHLNNMSLELKSTVLSHQ